MLAIEERLLPSIPKFNQQASIPLLPAKGYEKCINK
jgi:hypothetical protein